MDGMKRKWQWPGSRWWRVDLHAHSPASEDFDRPDPAEKDWAGWVEAAANANLDAIAITDHDTASGIAELQAAAARGSRTLVLFPGVEMKAANGVHLLVLMDPTGERQHVEDLLSRAGIPVSARGTASARSRLSVEGILDELGEDAVILGAHVNGPKGILRAISGQERLAVLRHANLAGVEVNPDLDLDERWLDGSKEEVGRRIPKVWGSDAHDPSDLGRRSTWVKMTKPDIEGLRLALLDGQGSIEMAAGESPGDPNGRRGDLAIEWIRVEGGRFIGRPNPLVVRFNPWLNAIIGGRGTGKSTLVDFCRKALRREAELDRSGDRGEEGSLRQLFERRMRVPPSGREGLLTEDTRIEVVYRKHGERFGLTWSRTGADAAIVRLDGDRRIPEEGSVSERFPVRVYSQKQLFALAQDPDALLSIIDGNPDVRAAEREREIERLRTRYLSLCAQGREAAARARGLGGLRAQLGDVQRKLGFLQEGGHAEQLGEYREKRQLDDTWDAVLVAARAAVRRLAEAAEQLEVADLPGIVDRNSEEDPTRGLVRSHAALSREVGGLRRTVLDGVDGARREIDAILKGDDFRAWRRALAKSEERFRLASRELSELDIGGPSEYTDLLSEAKRLGREIQVLEGERASASRLAREADDVIKEYRERRRALGRARADFATATSGATIRVEVTPLANSRGLPGTLADILGTERFEADRQALADRIRSATGEWSWDGLDRLIADIRRFMSAEADSWPAEDHRFRAALRRVTPERIDRLVLYAPDDRVTVSFRKDGHTRWRPLRQGSPGQQTAALLAFALGHGSEPIILDQPEDDLDNTLIYELLVSQIKETKRRRQIIVVTHNPNIVVHGDAEFVLSLDAGEGQTRIKRRGGLQEEKVRDEICRVMEGGREAFESRYRRIMPQGARS